MSVRIANREDPDQKQSDLDLGCLSKIVRMIRKYHNHKLQTNPWHH